MNNTKSTQKYVGIHKDLNGGMTDTGKIIRDAWVFGFIPETQTCEGWNAQGIQDLWGKTSAEWKKYGFLVGNLPDDLREKFERIQGEAISHAKASGWNPEQDISEDH